MKKDPTGIYNKRVTLLFPSGTVVVNGIEKTNYISGATVWSAWDVRPPKGKKIVMGETNHAIETRWIKIRYNNSINSTWRIRYNNVVYEIASPPIDEEMRHRELYLEIKVVE